MPVPYADEFIRRKKAAFIAALKSGKKAIGAAKAVGTTLAEFTAWAHHDPKFAEEWDLAVGRDPARWKNGQTR